MSQWQHFLSMGGYASFVWPAYGLCALTLLSLPLVANRRRRSILKAIRSQHASAS